MAAAPHPPPTAASALRLGPIHLTVADLGRSVAFYHEALGLQIRFAGAAAVGLGAGLRELLVLHEHPDATQAAGHARLSHLALACPDRLELARALQRLDAACVSMTSSREHPTHSSIYLTDPDGNGLELSCDHLAPSGRLGAGAGAAGAGHVPIDLERLRALVPRERMPSPAHPGTVVGHLHLLVGDVDRAVAFYAEGIGFTLMARGDDEAYLASDGYHHHLGLGAWVDDAAAVAPPESLGLRCWTVLLATSARAEAIGARLRRMGFVVRGSDGVLATRDPWGLGIALVPRAA